MDRGMETWIMFLFFMLSHVYIYICVFLPGCFGISFI